METVTRNQTALLVMDNQNSTVAFTGNDQAYLTRLSQTIEAARQNGVRVIFVRARFRPGYPEISPNNKLFTRAYTNAPVPAEPDDLHPVTNVQPGEIVVTKLRASAFTGSDLEIILRSLGINHLVLSGLVTSGVVLSTLLEAADKDYKITLLADCCADHDPETHRVLTTKIFPRYAEVVNAADWTAQLPQS